MIATLRHVGSVFDALYDVTSNETLQFGVYRNTRPRDGIYSITSTQSSETTYRAGATPARERRGTAPNGNVKPINGETARTRPARDPVSADD